VTIADDQVRKVLLRRSFALEYATLAWNVAGIVVLAVAAIVARAGFALDSLIEIGASTVVIWELSGTKEGDGFLMAARRIFDTRLELGFVVERAKGIEPCGCR
jgi:hypothetical protein